MTDAYRDKRVYPLKFRSSEFRSPFEKDRDRIVYSSAFRRLAGVTQVINPSEGQVFHNRLTHSLKVAQIGRRVAQRIGRKFPPQVDDLGGLDPDVVETAALAHDLGNPPFGHIAERRLNKLIQEDGGNHDGFDGNAQTFRIVNKLARAYKKHPGLNLTYATLNAILKYPWLRGGNGEKPDKFGAYTEEIHEFTEVRNLYPGFHNIRTLEAALMDIADDITYAIHDLEDFYRANIIPIEYIKDTIPTSEFVDALKKSNEDWFKFEGKSDSDYEGLVHQFFKTGLGRYMLMKYPYVGSKEQRVNLHVMSSIFISQLVESIKLSADILHDKTPIILDARPASELIILKRITKYFVIDSQSVLRVQKGEVKIIEDLYQCLMDASADKDWVRILPMAAIESLVDEKKQLRMIDKPDRARIVGDVISNLTDQEAIILHGRMMGIAPGSVFEHVL